MKRVLIANRGEIAVRIVRACRDCGLDSVAVYADGDADAPFVRMADEAHALRGTSAAETYLHVDKLIEAARRSGADAVHPGYGFLSERAEFARRVLAEGLTWIGPDPDVIEALGDKVEARRIARRVGAPMAEGSEGPLAGPDEAVAFARRFGLPIAIKAAHGGGGRGLRIARELGEVEDLFRSAVREAEGAFGRGECFVERFIERPRHVEAQVLADRHGHVEVVGTRDCSLQRRNQKLVEEAPAPFLTPEQRERIETAARGICREAGYVGAGTVEFLVGADGTISFLEVNTRLQVEHPVTEETTGIDLVAEQFRIAEGLPLTIRETPEPRGHAIEFRINAEDPGRGFLPASGTITRFSAPSGPGIRLDSGVEAGSAVPSQFDSLVAKLVVTGATRDEALARARRALREFVVEGVPTVIPFHRAVLDHPDFAGERFAVHTRWIETEFMAGEAAARPAPPPPLLRASIEIDGRMVEIGLPPALLGLLGSGGLVAAPADALPEDPNAVCAPLPGTLAQWRVSDGASVEAGETLAVIDAMKMETPVAAPAAGILRRLAPEGAGVAAGETIARVEPVTP
ncbi:acetyl/propionyl/methylcrotonyl-CoA carboxylase subunit alpha [Aureimonas jatrophae]|uniref:biotin carboxylase n=1 Tax=Aureimonas jatrophae TaxID=1166073 RepID=A0A1H0HGN3_9HYPH|nr:biotin carboxylase N-terminal domain-containing protein [Aureimonas jatrophae]MBB3950584.1 acetyl-CoA/propionyl-CoA carboxylase biotin carboxyl carrier protein [Aureimonas jatrophae]SDO18379.1 biotin carboxyl carrier protein /biotin carboxylase [Aureimonas jatrophae]